MLINADEMYLEGSINLLLNKIAQVNVGCKRELSRQRDQFNLNDDSKKEEWKAFVNHVRVVAAILGVDPNS